MQWVNSKLAHFSEEPRLAIAPDPIELSVGLCVNRFQCNALIAVCQAEQLRAERRWAGLVNITQDTSSMGLVQLKRNYRPVTKEKLTAQHSITEPVVLPIKLHIFEPDGRHFAFDVRTYAILKIDTNVGDWKCNESR